MHKVTISGIDTSSLPKLSAAKSRELLDRIGEGDEEARELFLRANMRLVLSVVGRFSASRESADDLFQAGMVGMMKALNNFDRTLGMRFSTYAVPMIIGEIRRYLRDRTGVKVPRSMRDTAYKALKAREKLVENRMEDPALTEIAAEIGADMRQVACALDAVSEPVYLQEPVYNDGEEGMVLEEQIGDGKNTEERWTDKICLSDAIADLPEKERKVLILRYYYGKTQTEISKQVNISQAQVSRLEKNALSKMKAYF